MTSNILQDNELPFEDAKQDSSSVISKSEEAPLQSPLEETRKCMMLDYYKLIGGRSNEDLLYLVSLAHFKQDMTLSFNIPKSRLLSFWQKNSPELTELLHLTDLKEELNDNVDLEKLNGILTYNQPFKKNNFEYLNDLYQDNLAISNYFISYLMNERDTFLEYLTLVDNGNQGITCRPIFRLKRFNHGSYHIEIDSKLPTLFVPENLLSLAKTGRINIRKMLGEYTSIYNWINEKITDQNILDQDNFMRAQLRRTIFKQIKYNGDIK